jgi:hypothetical protein
VGEVDDDLEWKDEYAMAWYVLLVKGCTICTPDGARHGRTRIGAFPSKLLAEHKTLPDVLLIYIFSCHKLSR